MNLAPPNRLRQNGQALVEYMLLIVVVVGIAMGLATKFFTPVQKWTNFYMGTYTQCLLDNGLLPGSATVSDNICNQMALNAGFGANGTVSGQGSGTPSATNDSTSAASAATKARAQVQASIGANQSNSSIRRGSRGGGGGGGGTFPDTPQATKGAGDGVGAGKILTARDRGSYRSYASEAPVTEGTRQQVAINGISGYGPAEKPELLSKEEKVARDHQEDDDHMRPKKLTIKPTVRKAASLEESSDDFSFGGLIRLVIICIIVFAIIYVVSTQVNSVMKGMEK